MFLCSDLVAIFLEHRYAFSNFYNKPTSIPRNNFLQISSELILGVDPRAHYFSKYNHAIIILNDFDSIDDLSR